MVLILGECCNNYSAAAQLWQSRFLDRFPHSRKVFSSLINPIGTDGIVQPRRNRDRKIYGPVRDERSADILASAIVAPNDSLRRRARDSGISKSTIQRIFEEQKFHPYTAQLHRDLNENDYRVRIEFRN